MDRVREGRAKGPAPISFVSARWVVAQHLWVALLSAATRHSSKPASKAFADVFDMRRGVSYCIAVLCTLVKLFRYIPSA